MNVFVFTDCCHSGLGNLASTFTGLKQSNSNTTHLILTPNTTTLSVTLPLSSDYFLISSAITVITIALKQWNPTPNILFSLPTLPLSSHCCQPSSSSNTSIKEQGLWDILNKCWVLVEAGEAWHSSAIPDLVNVVVVVVVMAREPSLHSHHHHHFSRSVAVVWHGARVCVL